jgi:uncharacterized protein YjiS (DUF1127 family)
MSNLAATFIAILEKSPSRPSGLKGLFPRLVNEIRLRRAFRDVEALDDEALLDIGIGRGGIEDAVRNGRYRGT